MDKIKAFLKLYALYAKMDFFWLTQNRLFAVLSVSADILSNVAAISGVLLLAVRFGSIGGMNENEILFMLSYCTLVTGVFQVFFSGNNTGHISRRIGRGQLEHMLIQPLPLPVQLLTEGFLPFSGSGNLLAGIVIMATSVKRLEMNFTVRHAAMIAGHLLITMIIILALSYLASTVTFFAPVQAEEISTFVIDSFGTLSEYPLSGMGIRIQLPLLTVIPSGLMGWFQCLAILGKPPLGLPEWYPALFAAALSMAAAYFFRKGLKHYVNKGINRYSAAGHRC